MRDRPSHPRDQPYLGAMDNVTQGTRLADRALIRVSGEDSAGFLQGLLTQDVAGLAASGPRWSGLLTPQGKALFDFILWPDDASSVLIDCEAGQADALARRLALYRLRRPISIEAASGAVHWSATPPAVGATPDPRHLALGYRWLGPEDAAVATQWHAHRLALGVTEGIGELGNGETLWLECNARELGGVSFSKGCYIGQENTARMHHRAKVNRRLIVAPIAPAGDRTRALYPALELMVELRRIDALSDALMPDWLQAALATGGTTD